MPDQEHATIRECLEAIRDMSQIALLGKPSENAGVHRQAVEYAVAALALLDQPVPDDWHDDGRNYRLLFDPAPRGDAA
jgi:hypothetical protein